MVTGFYDRSRLKSSSDSRGRGLHLVSDKKPDTHHLALSIAVEPYLHRTD